MRIEVPQARARGIFSRLFKAGLRAVDPYGAMLRSISIEKGSLVAGPYRYPFSRYRRIVAIGAGKASARMAQSLEHVLGESLESGLVVVKYGHGVPTKTVQIVEAGHPVPDQQGLAAARRLLDVAKALTEEDLLIVLLSGGASSLLPAPVNGLTLQDKQHATQLLLRSGATIQEMNTVRKHLSSLKGGQLAAATRAQVLTLLLSDVIGNDIGTIGSGPTAPDDTTFSEAWTIVRRYRLDRTISPSVRRHLLRGVQGRVPETPTSKSAVFKRVRHHMIGGNSAAVDAVSGAALTAGLRPMVIGSTLTGEAKEAAKVFGAMAREIADRARPLRRPCCLLAGGELTVSVTGKGKGGRAQEFALAAAGEIAGLKKIWIAGFATDGSDGPTDVAGAIVDGNTVAVAKGKGLDAAQALHQNDAYPFFQKAGGHIITGPTGTNVNDLYLLLAL
jgi:hydroxypyruvate reductase